MFISRDVLTMKNVILVDNHEVRFGVKSCFVTNRELETSKPQSIKFSNYKSAIDYITHGEPV